MAKNAEENNRDNEDEIAEPKTTVKRPRGRPRKTAKDGVEKKTAKPADEETKKMARPVERVPRDQPSEWIVPKDDDDYEDEVTTRRAAKVRPADDDTLFGNSDESDDSFDDEQGDEIGDEAEDEDEDEDEEEDEEEISDDEIRARREAARAVVADIGRMKTNARAMDSYIAVPSSDGRPANSGFIDSEELEQPLSRKDYWKQRHEERGKQRTNGKRDRQRLGRNGNEGDDLGGQDLPTLNVAKLQALETTELFEMAEAQGITETLPAIGLHELVFALLRNHATLGGAVVGEGYLELNQLGQGWLRNETGNFKSCPEDTMVPHQVVRRYNLRPGDYVVAKTRPPTRDRRDREFTATEVVSVNGMSFDDARRMPAFDSLPALHPNIRIKLETEDGDVTTRIVDLFAPIGFGQRGLIAAPSRTGRSMLLVKIANAILKNHPGTELALLLVGERPEEITDTARATTAKVFSTSFDEAAEKHVQMVEVACEIARRKAEGGKNVVVLLDSITRLARAYAAIQTASGKSPADIIDVGAFNKAKRIFSSARNLEGAGTVTIIATAMAETRNPVDEAMVEELKGAANMELFLERQMAAERVFPSINLAKSGTLREEFLVGGQDELERIRAFRAAYADMEPAEAMRALLKKMEDSPTNADLLQNAKTV